MSLLKFHYSSRSLGMDVPVNVILPEPFFPEGEGEELVEREIPAGGFQTLYLLHGLSDDQTAWTRKSSIERYVADRNLAVVMPNAGQSFYTDMACGQEYWTYLSQELPWVCQRYFPLSERREDNFVAGLSMGGYGAFKWALRRPDRFSAAASLSGALDMVRTVKGLEDPEEREKLGWVFGDLEQLEGSKNDLLQLARDLGDQSASSPALFQCCGTDDFLYESNLSFKNTVEQLPLDLTYIEEEGAAHEWEYWDRMIKRVLEWLPLK